MSIYAIPVDLTNPGQVLACMGFLEASEALLGYTEARFDWQPATGTQFQLRTEISENPFTDVLAFLVDAKAIAIAPRDWLVPSKITEFTIADTFPALEADATSLPILLRDATGHSALLSHWADGGVDETFKLYAGNRSAQKIANDMLREITTLWNTRHDALLLDPLNVLCSMGGSFNFDPRGAWMGLDVGYSINDLKSVKELEQKVVASPVVELMAAWGLQNARPFELSLRQYRYAVWNDWLPPQLARPALSGQLPMARKRQYQFALDLSGKNKIVCYAIQENTP
ncbi:type I-U CRISPR-associated protein Cas8c [Methylomonas sp. Kb3]|uniref:type I-G CRISPR-associated protein Cas8g2 n=1 Tax=Methylomonas sp. Kb3 TaxID=1611544 RepID=UPI0013FE0901|nr:type I-U CRISPR-associated protein Cas8c [Methylomonas sp. Kb3]